MKCINCNKEALYEYRLTQNKSLFYCGNDLPGFLEPRRKAGALAITAALSTELSSALDVLSDTPKVEEPIVEDDAPKPVKKAAKKKAE